MSEGSGLDVGGCSGDRAITVVGDDSGTMKSNGFASENVGVIEDREATSGSKNVSSTTLQLKLNPQRGKVKRLNKEPRTTSLQRKFMFGKEEPNDCAFIAASPSTTEEVVTILKQWYGTKYKGLHWLEAKRSVTLTSKIDEVALRRRKHRRSRKRKRDLWGDFIIG